ncbi:hypothetical protein DSO57_1004990 [Entomophthora muscae]|uniref:Uncharacterized protein n=1 Tax=Entomophthora muscae TaxID=34485 RepID=A0ACC2SWY5_9FUNG|nr:hypothetical protein DSO57_1004990 [Entomophthora muscae]
MTSPVPYRFRMNSASSSSSVRSQPTSTGLSLDPHFIDGVCTFQKSLEFQAGKNYMSGYLKKKNDLGPDKTPFIQRKWTEWYVELNGTSLMFWSIKSPSDCEFPRVEAVKKRSPNFINVADCNVYPVKSDDAKHVFILNSAGANRFFFQTQSADELSIWILALRLSCFEAGLLHEWYTALMFETELYAPLLSEGGASGYSGFVEMRCSGILEWCRYWMTIRSDAEGPTLTFSPAKYSTDLVFTVESLQQAYAIFPDQEELMDHASVLRLDGSVRALRDPAVDQANPPFILIMATTQREMLDILIAAFDAFRLHNRPRHYTRLSLPESQGLYLDLSEIMAVPSIEESFYASRQAFLELTGTKFGLKTLSPDCITPEPREPSPVSENKEESEGPEENEFEAPSMLNKSYMTNSHDSFGGIKEAKPRLRKTFSVTWKEQDETYFPPGSSDKSSIKSIDKSSIRAVDRSSDKSSITSVDKTSDKASIRSIDNVTKLVLRQLTRLVTRRVRDKASIRSIDKGSDKSSIKSFEKPIENNSQETFVIPNGKSSDVSPTSQSLDSPKSVNSNESGPPILSLPTVANIALSLEDPAKSDEEDYPKSRTHRPVNPSVSKTTTTTTKLETVDSDTLPKARIVKSKKPAKPSDSDSDSEDLPKVRATKPSAKSRQPTVKQIESDEDSDEDSNPSVGSGARSGSALEASSPNSLKMQSRPFSMAPSVKDKVSPFPTKRVQARSKVSLPTASDSSSEEESKEVAEDLEDDDAPIGSSFAHADPNMIRASIYSQQMEYGPEGMPYYDPHAMAAFNSYNPALQRPSTLLEAQDFARYNDQMTLTQQPRYGPLIQLGAKKTTKTTGGLVGAISAIEQQRAANKYTNANARMTHVSYPEQDRGFDRQKERYLAEQRAMASQSQVFPPDAYGHYPQPHPMQPMQHMQPMAPMQTMPARAKSPYGNVGASLSAGSFYHSPYHTMMSPPTMMASASQNHLDHPSMGHHPPPTTHPKTDLMMILILHAATTRTCTKIPINTCNMIDRWYHPL